MNLNEAAHAIGVSAITLKRWLLSGKVADVGRNRNNWRVFTEADIERIKKYALKQPIDSPNGQPVLGTPSTANRSIYSAASFFSGIGGFDIGFESAGFSISLQCEVEPFCQSILKKHWPSVPLHSDITKLTNNEIPKSDVWIGGFPCQDLSLARMGKRDGLRGRKSGLFYEFARLVGDGKPRVILLENVAGLLSSHRGKDFGIVLATLAELGYSVGWRTFNSKYFGVPQSRQRVYIVGCRGDGRGPGEILFESECGERDTPSSGSNGKELAASFQDIVGDPSGAGPVIQALAYCLYATSARHTGTDWSRNYVCYPKIGKVRRLIPAECEGVMSFPKGWTLPATTNLSADDLDSARYHALGNAVTPPVAAWLALRIRQYLESRDFPQESQRFNASLYTFKNNGFGQLALELGNSELEMAP
ncbi:DNA (cytosine-5-)-methyltransferase [Burkholderia glumae]|uniref:DNA (cytosine-5-)-methyltransferase n=1 Tax=Burkholderia glumae TaxID=337 RepID=UPI0009B77F30|nr:DNA (cytosine-5-)-methyltransferase [Burkholderia glumae]